MAFGLGDFDEEIRGHLAINIKERIDRGEDPESARLAALREFGNVTLTRDSMRGVWRHRWLDAIEALGRDIRFAMRALMRVKGLAATVVVTLALGIGANAAIFSVVRGVLLRPLVNRDEDRLLYIRQSAPGLATDNLTFSVPELDDLKARAKTIATFGDFSTVSFTDDRSRRPAPHDQSGCGRRFVLRRDGTAPGAWPSPRRARRWPESGGRGGAHVSLLEHDPQRRSHRHRQGNPPRSADGDSSRRPRTVRYPTRPTPKSSPTS